MVIAAGLLLALLAVLLVLEPVLRAAAGQKIELADPLFLDSDDEDDPVQRRRDRALAALREIDFDRATGKLSDGDYERLKATYTAEALAALREVDAAAVVSPALPPSGPPASDDAVEALIASARAEARRTGKKFCSECGAPLEGKGRFCVECGTPAAVAG
jgi:hypothetical protein